MASLVQQQHEANRILAVNVPPSNNLPTPSEVNHKKPWWRKFLSYVGPGFLVSLAYLDPGNMETDLQAGADHKYELLWVILIGLVFALIIQSLAANLGVATGKIPDKHYNAMLHGNGYEYDVIHKDNNI